jgi:hypothetical protein
MSVFQWIADSFGSAIKGAIKIVLIVMLLVVLAGIGIFMLIARLIEKAPRAGLDGYVDFGGGRVIRNTYLNTALDKLGY